MTTSAPTVNTLVLAYVGTSLPVLLIFGSGELGFFDAVNVELVAQEVVATLVGSIGLIAAVPITTAIAALLATAGRRRSTGRRGPRARALAESARAAEADPGGEHGEGQEADRDRPHPRRRQP